MVRFSMENDGMFNGALSRRATIAGFAATFSGIALPVLSGSNPDIELHDFVARAVKELAGEQRHTLRILLPDGSGGNVEPVIDEFRKRTGLAVQVSVSAVDDITATLTMDALSEANRFDVALPATFGLPDLVSANVIRPLSEYAQAYEPRGFRDAVLYQIGDRFDGDIYGFQADGDAYLMFYNKRFLDDPGEAQAFADRFGHKLSLPLTWQELDRQMAFFHRPDQNRWGGLLFRTGGYLAWEWWARFHAKGLWPFTPEMDPQVISDEGVGALEEMIRATEHLHPAARDLGLFGNWDRFSKGDIYCNVGWGGSQKFLNGPTSDMRGQMRYGPMPGGSVNGEHLATPYFNWGWSYVVSRSSRVPELSYLFALFASSPAMSTLAVRQTEGFFDPYRPEHYQDEGIRDAYSPEFLDVHRASLETAMPDLYLQGQGEYFRVLNTYINRALAGKLPAEEALRRVDRRWQMITESVDRSKQIKRWARLRQKYPSQLRNKLRNLV